MADFDAGSIEGRLDLDTDPFITGLRKARAEAQRFERERYTATVSTNYETTGDKPDAAAKDSSSQVSISADTSDFDRDAARVRAELEALDHEEAEPTVTLDTRKALMNTARLRDEMGRFRSDVERVGDPSLWRRLDNGINSVAGFYKANSSPGGVGSGHGLMALVGLAAALAPALGPATGAVALFGGAAVAAFGGAAVSMALYAKVAAGAFKTLTEAIKNGEQLTGVAGRAQTALMGLQGAWSKLQKDAEPGIFRMLIPVFQTLAGILPKLLPLINAISKGLTGAFKPIAALMESGKFDRFIALLTSNALKDLPQIGSALSHILGGLMGMFTALNPIIQVMIPWFVKMTAQFDRWANTKAPGAVSELFDIVQKYGPQTLTMFKALGNFVLNLGKAFAPLTGPALDFLTTLANGLSSLDLAPLAAGVGAVMTALGPFIGVLAELINILLPPLSVLLQTIAENFIGPLGKALASELVPAFDAFSSVLNTLAPVLGKVISSFADLVNPTGVAVFVALIEGLEGPINTLLPPLGELIVALESMVGIGLESLLPVIGPLGGALQVLADAIAPIVSALAAILSNKTVVQVILGIAAGIKVWSIAMAILNAVMYANPIGLVVIAIAALAVGLVMAYQHSETFRAIVDALWGAVKKLAGWIKEGLVAAFHFLSPVIGFVSEHLEVLFLLLGPLGIAIIAVIQIVKHWSDITRVLQRAWTAVLDFLKSIPGKIKGWFSSAGQWLINAGTSIMRGLWSGLNAYWRVVNGFYNKVGSMVKGWFSGAIGWLTSAGSAVLHGLWNGLSAYWRVVSSFYGSVASKFQGFFGGAIGWLSGVGGNIVQGLWNGLSSKFDSMMAWVSGKIEDLMSLFNKIPVIGSPSKRTWKVGDFIGQGLHLGLIHSFDKYVIPTAERSMERLMKSLKGSAVDVGVATTLDISATGTQAQIGSLAASVRHLTSSHEATSAGMLGTLDGALAVLTKAVEEQNDGLLDALTTAYEKAGNKQMALIITKMRTG